MKTSWPQLPCCGSTKRCKVIPTPYCTRVAHTQATDDDFCAHLAGSSRLLNSLSSLAANGGLGEAASWLALRQDIYISLTRSQPLSISLDGYTKSASLVQLDAESMANRAVFTCARVLAYAMGPSPEHDMGSQATDTLSEEVEHWHQLASQQTSCLWAEGLPAGKRNASAFPLLWMTCPAHSRFPIAEVLGNWSADHLYQLPGFNISTSLRCFSTSSIHA